VNADRRAVVAGVDLRVGQWRVALVAQGLAGIGAHFDGPFALMHRGQSEHGDGHGFARAPVEECQRGRHDGFFARDDARRTWSFNVRRGCGWRGSSGTGWRIWRPSRHRGNSTGPGCSTA